MIKPSVRLAFAANDEVQLLVDPEVQMVIEKDTQILVKKGCGWAATNKFITAENFKEKLKQIIQCNNENFARILQIYAVEIAKNTQ